MENVETNKKERVIKRITLKLPKFPKFTKRTRLGRIGYLLRGERARVGNYELELLRNSSYTSVVIYPIHKLTKKFWTYNGYGVLEETRHTTPRVREPFSYFLWELEKGEHKKNIKLSKEVIDFLDKLKELLLD